MFIIYHDDLDGRAAAAIVRKWALEQSVYASQHMTLVPMQYDTPFDPGRIVPGEEVFIVDFSFPPAMMRKIREQTVHVTWIDHHKTALRYEYADYTAGVRDCTKAACVLSWEYLYPGEPVPEAVTLIGDRDTWAWKYGEKTEHFYLGLSAEDTGPDSRVWGDLLKLESLTKGCLIRRGRTIKQYRDATSKQFHAGRGWEAEFEGRTIFVSHHNGFGPDGLGQLRKRYPICSLIAWDGERWQVSLYRGEGQKCVTDVGKIALRYGGGGHAGAAGFTCERLPFKKVRK